MKESCDQFTAPAPPPDSWCSDQQHQQDNLRYQSISRSPSVLTAGLARSLALVTPSEGAVYLPDTDQEITWRSNFVLGNTGTLSPRWKLKLSSHLSCVSTWNASPSLPHNHPLFPLDLPNSCEAAFSPAKYWERCSWLNKWTFSETKESGYWVPGFIWSHCCCLGCYELCLSELPRNILQDQYSSSVAVMRGLTTNPCSLSQGLGKTNNFCLD